jgi:excinuclease ABC subunit A
MWGLPEAKSRGYLPGRFSFNVKGGRCEACQGDRVIKIEMHFLPDVYVQCDVCKGRRYNRETLEVLFRTKSVADVLDMTVDEGADFFRAVPAIRDKFANPAAGPARLYPHRPAGDDLVGRRGAARQIAKERSRRSPVARSTSPTSRRPACISTMSASSSTCCTHWLRPATRCWSSSTTSK